MHHFDATNTVAMLVKPGREDGDADLTGQHPDDASSNSALGGDADGRKPVTCRIVHAAGGHHAKNLSSRAATDHSLPGVGVHTGVSQCRSHQCEIAHGHRGRALADIALDRGSGLLR